MEYFLVYMAGLVTTPIFVGLIFVIKDIYDKKREYRRSERDNYEEFPALTEPNFDVNTLYPLDEDDMEAAFTALPRPIPFDPKTFEDLRFIDDVGMQTMLRHIDKDTVAMALKGASNATKHKFFENMSKHAGKYLHYDMQTMGPVRLRDVDDAQKTIFKIYKELSSGGHIPKIG